MTARRSAADQPARPFFLRSGDGVGKGHREPSVEEPASWSDDESLVAPASFGRKEVVIPGVALVPPETALETGQYSYSVKDVKPPWCVQPSLPSVGPP